MVPRHLPFFPQTNEGGKVAFFGFFYSNQIEIILTLEFYLLHNPLMGNESQKD